MDWNIRFNKRGCVLYIVIVMMIAVVLVTVIADAVVGAIVVLAAVVKHFGWRLVIFSCTSSCLYSTYYFSFFAFGF